MYLAARNWSVIPESATKPRLHRSSAADGHQVAVKKLPPSWNGVPSNECAEATRLTAVHSSLAMAARGPKSICENVTAGVELDSGGAGGTAAHAARAIPVTTRHTARTETAEDPWNRLKGSFPSSDLSPALPPD